jgi:hypothetical protein
MSLVRQHKGDQGDFIRTGEDVEEKLTRKSQDCDRVAGFQVFALTISAGRPTVVRIIPSTING